MTSVATDRFRMQEVSIAAAAMFARSANICIVPGLSIVILLVVSLVLSKQCGDLRI